MRSTWAAGDYAKVAQLTEDAAAEAVAAAGHITGMDLLDVATGTGNAALLAAAAGAHVTGLDLTPDLFVTARRRAAELGVEVEWVEGNAEALPFAGANFDRVLSVCGVQFVPHHEAVACELVRVLRPGGRFVLANWQADGMAGETLALLAAAGLPDAAAARHWGDEAHVRGLLSALPVRLDFTPHTARLPFATPNAYVDFFTREYGSLVYAVGDRWPAVEAELRTLAARFHRDGGMEQAYWVITGDRTE